MLKAITRGISPCIGDCELTYLERQEIDAEKAMQQQKSYEQYLSSLGLSVTSLPAEPTLPDAVFVEDTAVVVDEVAVITTMGAISRRPEVHSISPALAEYRPLEFINSTGTLEGGDVMRVNRTLYVGVSTRTNLDGIAQLRSILRPYDYLVTAVGVKHCLHFKTGCTYLGRNMILVNREWVDLSPFEGFEVIDVPVWEPWAANVLVVGNDLLVPASCPRTGELLQARGFNVHTINVSELEKAEAGLTCMSIIFN
jgi:N-Dimethylarginine dimethylaminohydrolase